MKKIVKCVNLLSEVMKDEKVKIYFAIVLLGVVFIGVSKMTPYPMDSMLLITDGKIDNFDEGVYTFYINQKHKKNDK